MGLDIWFRDDIRNVLQGVDLASAHLAVRHSDSETLAYREGFRAALAAAALSFGIYPVELEAPRIRTVTSEPGSPGATLYLQP